MSHDLDHAFDDTVPSPATGKPAAFTPVLVLRSFFSPLPSLEFRCFVKDRNLVAITQRDLHHYAFLRSLRAQIVTRVRELFNTKMRFTFPDACFVFDVYIPEADYNPADSDSDSEDESDRTRLGRARLIDINPWAPRTDSLLFDWGELLGIQVARPFLGTTTELELENKRAERAMGAATEKEESEEEETTAEEEEEEEEDHEPELRLVEHDDPAAYNFSSPQYSAHKLPKDVVDASMAGEGGMREFAREWQRITEGRGQSNATT